jgi:TusE/DsrC/DsvC family sulfur relay protein
MTTEYESAVASSLVAEMQGPWSEEQARRLAAEKGLGELTEVHWRVIHTLRDHFVQYGALPPMRLACSINHLDPHCTEQLFRGAREAWRLAGLPEPGAEAAVICDDGWVS